MLQRLRDSGLNLMVLLVSLLVFLGAFFGLSYFAASQRPPQLSVLAAARDLAIGEMIAPDDLVERTVYQDENASLYIPAEEMGGVVGGVAALPVDAGQLLFRSAVLAPVGEGMRLSAALAEHPGHSLFPLPLSAQNVIAPDARSFLPGDLVGITVVIASRPQAPATPVPPAQVLVRPLCCGEGRLCARAAAILQLISAYSPFKYSLQTESMIAAISS